MGTANTFGVQENFVNKTNMLKVNQKNFKKKGVIKNQNSTYGQKELDFFQPNAQPPTDSTKASTLEGHSGDQNPSAAPEKNSLGWFIEEDDRLFKGPDFATQEEDLCKLVKHIKGYYSKSDLYRYRTDPLK